MLGFHGQCPGDGDPLLLTAGELLRVGVSPVAESDSVQQRLRFGGDFVPGAPKHMDWRFHDVLQHGHVREQIEALEHYARVQP